MINQLVAGDGVHPRRQRLCRIIGVPAGVNGHQSLLHQVLGLAGASSYARKLALVVRPQVAAQPREQQTMSRRVPLKAPRSSTLSTLLRSTTRFPSSCCFACECLLVTAPATVDRHPEHQCSRARAMTDQHRDVPKRLYPAGVKNCRREALSCAGMRRGYRLVSSHIAALNPGHSCLRNNTENDFHAFCNRTAATSELISESPANSCPTPYPHAGLGFCGIGIPLFKENRRVSQRPRCRPAHRELRA